MLGGTLYVPWSAIVWLVVGTSGFTVALMVVLCRWKRGKPLLGS
jgi:hypothetical protein